jgi:hypothetical protein
MSWTECERWLYAPGGLAGVSELAIHSRAWWASASEKRRRSPGMRKPKTLDLQRIADPLDIGDEGDPLPVSDSIGL